MYNEDNRGSEAREIVAMVRFAEQIAAFPEGVEGANI